MLGKMPLTATPQSC